MKQKDALKIEEEELKSLTEAAYERIKQAIIAGGFPPGSRLSERTLSEHMRVSTTTIKRALGRLNVEGLVEIRPRRGTYVAESFSNSMEENTVIRAYLEGLAARFAALKAEPADLDNLRRQLDQMRERTEKGPIRRLVEANTKFHRSIHEVGKNPYISRLIDVIRTFDLKFRGRALSDHEEAKRGFQEHFSVYEAIAARDGDLAEERMKNHILRTLAFVLEEEGKSR